MQAFLICVIFITASLHAASLEPYLFMCYVPTDATHVRIQSTHDRDAKKLSLSLADLATYSKSDKVTLSSNWLFPTSDLKTRMKLSLVAHAQYPFSTINGRFLALPCQPSSRHLVSLSAIILDKRLNEHITSIGECIHILRMQQYAHPVLILDVAAWLTCCFGPRWQLQLPIYNYCGEPLTKVEYDVLFPPSHLRIKKGH